METTYMKLEVISIEAMVISRYLKSLARRTSSVTRNLLGTGLAVPPAKYEGVWLG